MLLLLSFVNMSTRWRDRRILRHCLRRREIVHRRRSKIVHTKLLRTSCRAASRKCSNRVTFRYKLLLLEGSGGELVTYTVIRVLSLVTLARKLPHESRPRLTFETGCA